MTDSISEQVKRGFGLLYEGKGDALMQLITNLEIQSDLNPEDKHYCQFLKATHFLLLGRIDDALKISEQVYIESRKMKKTLFSIDALCLKFWAYWLQHLIMRHRRDDPWRVVDECEKMLKFEFQEPLSETEPRKAFYYYMKGHLYTTQRDNDQALEYHKKSLAILERYRMYSYLLPSLLQIMGLEYEDKGELDLAMKSHKRSLELSNRSYMLIKITNGYSYRNIGQIHYQQGKLALAAENLEKSLNLYESIKSFFIPSEYGLIFDNLIRISIDENSPQRAKEYFHHFQKVVEENKLSEDYWLYKLSKVRILKLSTRTRNRAEAEKLLLELIEQHEAIKKRLSRGMGEEWTPTLIELCDYYIEELRVANDLEILDDIQPLVLRLLKESERTNSYSLQAQTYLLQAKISLLTFKMKEARRFLTQAERIAERYGLVQLVTEISRLHKDIMQQMETWDNLEEINAPVSKRMELAHLGKNLAKKARSKLAIVAKISEKSVTVYKEHKKCLVCKGDIEGFNNYICSKCDSIYCEKCARALIGIENACWSCESPIDKSKPIKSMKQEVKSIDITQEKAKKK